MSSNQFPRRSTNFNKLNLSSRLNKSNISSSSNTQKSRQRQDDVGKEWMSKRRKKQQKNLRISESTDSTPSSRSDSYEIYSSPVKFKASKKEELDLEEDSPPLIGRISRPENIDIIEESDSSQQSSVAMDYANDIDEIQSSPDFKSQQSNQKRYDEFVVETSSSSSDAESNATMIDINDEIVEEEDDDEEEEVVGDSNPIVSQEEAISEAMQYLSHQHNFNAKHHEREMSPDIFSSPVKRTKKKRAGNSSFAKKITVEEEDSLNIEEDEDVEVVSASQSESGEHAKSDDSDEEERKKKSHDITMMTTTDNPDDTEEMIFNSEDSDSDTERDDEESSDDGDDSEEEEKNPKNNDLLVNFIKPDKPGTPKPEIISATIISTYTNDGLVYTELDNEIVVITPALFRVKDRGILTYESGTGIQFSRPTSGDKPSRIFIACPNMAKDNLI